MKTRTSGWLVCPSGNKEREELMNQISVVFVDMNWYSVLVVFLNLAAWAGIAFLVYHFLQKRKKNRKA